MPQAGRIAFGKMEAVTFGRRAAEALPEEARRYEAERVFLMVSGTLNRDTDEIAKVRRALGNRYAGIFDRMPPHTPRHAVIEAAAMAREAKADLIATIGGGSVTDGAKAVQLCLANDIRWRPSDRARDKAGRCRAGGPPSLSSCCARYSVRRLLEPGRPIVSRGGRHRRCDAPAAHDELLHLSRYRGREELHAGAIRRRAEGALVGARRRQNRPDHAEIRIEDSSFVRAALIIRKNGGNPESEAMQPKILAYTACIKAELAGGYTPATVMGISTDRAWQDGNDKFRQIVARCTKYAEL
jgi:hypothetical protein